MVKKKNQASGFRAVPNNSSAKTPVIKGHQQGFLFNKFNESGDMLNPSAENSQLFHVDTFACDQS